MAYGNPTIITHRATKLADALEQVGIKPGKTLQRIIDGNAAFGALNKRLETTGGTGTLTRDIVDIIKAGDTDKALAALQDEKLLHGALLELVWNTQRREAVADELANDITAQAPQITAEELPKLQRKFQREVADPMHQAADKLPADLVPADILADPDKVARWRAMEQAKNEYPAYVAALDALTALGGYGNTIGRRRPVFKHAQVSTFETPEDYQAAANAGAYYPWAVVTHNGQLGINDPEETTAAYAVADQAPATTGAPVNWK